MFRQPIDRRVPWNGEIYLEEIKSLQDVEIPEEVERFLYECLLLEFEPRLLAMRSAHEIIRAYKKGTCNCISERKIRTGT